MARIAMALEALSITVSYYPSPITRTSARAATATGTDDPQQIPSRAQTDGPRVWTPSGTPQRPAPIRAEPQCRRRDITRAPSPRMCDECDSRAARAHESAAASLPTRPTLLNATRTPGPTYRGRGGANSWLSRRYPRKASPMPTARSPWSEYAQVDRLPATRDACARNPYVPRVSSHPCAFFTKRCSILGRVLPG
jgi:hypothetical protein